MAALHHANVSTEPDNPEQNRKNARLGILLFLVYFVFYASFVLVNTFAPSWMEWTPWAGINLAILSGMGLIVFAVVLAFLYGILCRGQAGAK